MSKPDLRWKGNMRAWPASNATLRLNSTVFPKTAKPAIKTCTMARSAKIANVVTRRRRGRMFQKFRWCIKPRAFRWSGCINTSAVIIATPQRAPRNSSICRCSAGPVTKKILPPPPIPIIVRPDFQCAASSAITARLPVGKLQDLADRASITAEPVFH